MDILVILAKIILEEGTPISGSVRLKTYDKLYFYSHLLSFCRPGEHLQIVEGELTEKQIWDANLKGCAAVIHCSSTNPITTDSDDLKTIFPSFEGSINILSAMKTLGIKRKVMTSSFSDKGGKYKATSNEETLCDPNYITHL